jgi:hypothetical protein
MSSENQSKENKHRQTKYKRYNPVARVLRQDGRSVDWLYHQAKSDGKTWGYNLFRRVASGWHKHAEIELWLEERGYGEALREAQEMTRKLQLEKLRGDGGDGKE